MSFWSWLRSGTPNYRAITANANPPEDPASVGEPDWNPGDPEGLELQGFDEDLSSRALPFPQPSPWSGWPEKWSTPGFTSNMHTGINKLADVAWACLDRSTNALSSMPVYRLKDSRIIEPTTWMTNPDPTIYTSWQEFAKQVFWDFQLGEVFILPMLHGSDGFPARFRVIPPWLVEVEMVRGGRSYKFAGQDVTAEILHIRYASNTVSPRGFGPLEIAGARMTTIGLLQRYASNLAETGGVPHYWIGVDRVLRNKSEATDLLDTWIETRSKYAGYPAVLGSGASLNQSQSMNARDMALMELSQFNESRIAVLLGIPPFLVGLAGASGSLTYSNISDLFDFHDRSDIRPKANNVMSALSGWALPRGQTVELNRDDYTRLPLDKRYAAYKTAIEMGFLTIEEVRSMERFRGEPAATALSGGID